MGVGTLAELTTYVKKIAGKFEKKVGIIVYPVFSDHTFRPHVEVTDTQECLEFPVPVSIVKLTARDCDVYINFNRPITANEYTVIFSDTTKLINLKTQKIYYKAPAGLSGYLNIEGLIET